jgi:hypothetical protein
MNRFLLAMLVLAATLAGQTVTAVTTVLIDGKPQRVRKINGRWWSDDNRELSPTKEGFIWYLSSKKGEGWTFHHHRPLDLARVEQLHLFQDPGSVESLLGQPNFESGARRPGDSIMWHYYAENGTAVLLMFIRDELAIAKYERKDFGVSGKPVQSVDRELAGREIFKVMADRASKSPRSPADYGRNAPTRQSGSTTTVRNVPVTPDPPQRRISPQLVDSVKQGMTRAEVVAALGEPSGGMAIAGGESDYEDMTYLLAPTGEVSLHLENGKVVRISK